MSTTVKSVTFSPQTSKSGTNKKRSSFFQKWKKRLSLPHGIHPRYSTPVARKLSACISFMEGAFSTRQLAPKNDRELLIRYTFREVAIYSIFLFTLTMMTVGMGSATPFLFTQMMTNLFVVEPLGPGVLKTLETSVSVEDFWMYVRHVLPNAMYDEKMYSDKWPVKELDEPEKYGILYENQLVGLPRLRQLRVKSNNCPAADNFRYLTRECFPSYSKELENYDWAIPKDIDHDLTIKSAWEHNSEVDLNGRKYVGQLTTYSGAGAIQTLSKRRRATVKIIQNLYKHEWINRGTRAVFLDFTVYNANVNLFCIVRILWEFPATGGLTTSWNFRTLRLIQYHTNFEMFVVLPCTIGFGIFTLYYLIQEILEFVRLPWKEYSRDLYNWLDVIILLLSVTCIVFSSIQTFSLVDVLTELEEAAEEDEEIFHDLYHIGYVQTAFHNTIAICVFFAWVKVFKYSSFNKTMTQLSATLSRASFDVIGFTIMFFIVFFAFAQLGYLLFGSQVRDFRTFEESVFTLMRLIVGEFNFRRIEAVNRVLGPLYFLAYVFFIFFVLLNMFLAIITDTYSEVKAEIQAQRNEFEFSDYVCRSFNNFIGLFKRRNIRVDAEDAVKLAPADGQLTYEEIRKSLRRAGFTDTEIKVFLARFGVKPGVSLDEEDTQFILDNLEGENSRQETSKPTMQNNKLNPKHIALHEQFARMQLRLINLEVGLTKLIHKVVNLTKTLKE